ncbi:MAG: ComEC/Rec2 family competence protein, partial [Flavobacteriales bacterium]|nr:ComEC/Rec2 family competence protein [Flavobacteriales bacterium]
RDRGAPIEAGEDAVVQLDVTQVWPRAGRQYRAVGVLQSGTPLLLKSSIDLVQPGQTIVACVQCADPDTGQFPSAFDEAQFLRGRGILWSCDVKWSGPARATLGIKGASLRWAASMKSRLIQRCSGLGGSDGAGLLLALMSGDRRSMGRDVRRAFADVGLSHLVAVSGFHIGLLSGLVVLLLRGLGCPPPWRPWLFLPVVWAYVLMCGCPGSALRAATMVSCVALADAFDRTADGLTVLSAVGLFLYALSPVSMEDLGMGLSFTATAGILMLHQHIKRSAMAPRHRRVTLLVGIPVVATMCTAPLSWPTFGLVPVGFLPANLLATPAVSLLMALALCWMLSPWSEGVLSDILVGCADAFVCAVQWWGGIEPVVLPVDRFALTLSGTVLAVGCFWGLSTRCALRPMLGSVLMAWALLRWQCGLEERPHSLSVGRDGVGRWAGRGAVFPQEPPRSIGAIQWKTRSLLERVSRHPPEPVRWCGTGWVMSTHHILYTGRDGRRHVVSSSPLRCGLPALRRTPKPPCP